MLAVSDAWKTKQLEVLTPEGFVEISYVVTKQGLQEEALASSTDEAVFSNIGNILNTTNLNIEQKKYATNELNLWVLDESRNLLPDENYNNTGYVGDGTIKLSLEEVHTQPIPGITIRWCSEFGEYPTLFTVTAYNGNTIVAQKTVENDSVETIVDLEIRNYDSIVITVPPSSAVSAITTDSGDTIVTDTNEEIVSTEDSSAWSLPNRRARIEQVILGYQKIFTKRDLVKFTHEQSGCLLSGELPNNRITFSLDNSTDMWNPNNPQGFAKYLAEQQKLIVKYGFDIDGAIEWIKAGTFYISEWNTPSNGIEATFKARDLIGFMLDAEYNGRAEGTLYEIVEDAIASSNLPIDAKVYIDNSLKNYRGVVTDNTCAELLQLCANASRCVIYQDRNGTLRIEPLRDILTEYVIRKNWAYSYPEYELTKPLKSVTTTFANNETITYVEADVGEKQTMHNELISTPGQAYEVARYVASILKNRQIAKGEFRIDPRLDVFDKVRIESKYGVNEAVIITDVKCSFTGAFKGSYTGRVVKFDPVVRAYSGEVYAGEV